MPVLGFPRIPTRIASGGRLIVAEWGSQPVNARETPTISPALRPLSLAVTSVGRAARSTPRDSLPFCHKQTETERRSGASPLWLEPGDSAPHM
jgi:hypothetical protein